MVDPPQDLAREGGSVMVDLLQRSNTTLNYSRFGVGVSSLG